MLHLILATLLTFAQYNCENLFDCEHDTLKDDTEFLPDSPRRWVYNKYWAKVRNVAQSIIACGNDEGAPPDFVTLCEVENDTVMRDLTRRSQLREMNYQYVMTHSPDVRGIDVALLYNPFAFRPLRHYSLAVDEDKGKRPLRHILYVAGTIITDDTIHIFVVHAPSRSGGKRKSSPRREAVARRVCQSVDSIRALSPEALIIVAGDFNDSAGDPSLKVYDAHHFANPSSNAKGKYAGEVVEEVKASYRYKGEWETIDNILVSRPLLPCVEDCFVNAPSFLLEEDKQYGGLKPRRSFLGYRFRFDGYSDHLPVVIRFRFDK